MLFQTYLSMFYDEIYAPKMEIQPQDTISTF